MLAVFAVRTALCSPAMPWPTKLNQTALTRPSANHRLFIVKPLWSHCEANGLAHRTKPTNQPANSNLTRITGCAV